MLATPAQRDMGSGMEEQYKKVRPVLGKRTNSGNSVTTALSKIGKSRRDEEYKIKVHLAGTLARQNYLRRLCKALMMYGAPTHRLEEYMNMSARVLEIEAQFLYMYVSRPLYVARFLPSIRRLRVYYRSRVTWMICACSDAVLSASTVAN
jgi:hypothetical protein